MRQRPNNTHIPNVLYTSPDPNYIALAPVILFVNQPSGDLRFPPRAPAPPTPIPRESGFADANDSFRNLADSCTGIFLSG